MGFTGRNSALRIEYSKVIIHNTLSFRFALTIKTTSKIKKEIIVIMKNPSSTCLNLEDGINVSTTSSSKLRKSRIDRTTGYVYRFLKNHYKRIIILNLYPIYSSNPIDVNAYYHLNNNIVSISINDTFISQTLKKYPYADIACAWGGPNGINNNDYDARIGKIFSIIGKRNTLQYDITSKQLVQYSYQQQNQNKKCVYPLHGLKWR